MKENNPLDEYKNNIVNATLRATLNIDNSSFSEYKGSGCIIVYRERLFFISLINLNESFEKRGTIEIRTGFKNSVTLFPLLDLNIIDVFDAKYNELVGPEFQKLKTLKFCFTEFEEPKEIIQVKKIFDTNVDEPRFKKIVYTNLDIDPNRNESYSFLGIINDGNEFKTKPSEDNLFSDLKFDSNLGSIYKFLYKNKIHEVIDKNSTAGAPIFSEKGELVALVMLSIIEEKNVYGFSIIKLKEYLDSYIDLKPNNDGFLKLSQKKNNEVKAIIKNSNIYKNNNEEPVG